MLTELTSLAQQKENNELDFLIHWKGAAEMKDLKKIWIGILFGVALVSAATSLSESYSRNLTPKYSPIGTFFSLATAGLTIICCSLLIRHTHNSSRLNNIAWWMIWLAIFALIPLSFILPAISD